MEDPDAGELAESDTNEPVIVIEPALVGWFPLAVSSPPPAQTMPAAAKQHTKTRDLYAAPVFPRLTALHESRISDHNSVRREAVKTLRAWSSVLGLVVYYTLETQQLFAQGGGPDPQLSVLG